MKTFIFATLMLFTTSAFACLEKVQEQIDAQFNGHYFLDIEDRTVYKLGDVRLLEDFFFIANEEALNDPSTPVYRVESSAMGCYGYEFAAFDSQSCTLWALGGGYCD